ncbi:MAG: efflux RND transporter periplasmic adaptor subunit [Bacteroidales bacterium]|nr:efflux RND transporter periplasmic adaptor subunit [Bacteroidales bacterium]
MKTLAQIVTILLLVSCGISKDEKIKNQIESKKAKIVMLEKSINELEKELTDTAEMINPLAVEIKEMKNEVFRHYITVFGNVEADLYAKISPEMNGQITGIHVEEGQRVRKGHLLVSLNTEATESSINELKTNLELARITYEKQKNLWDQGIGSEIQYLQAKAQKESAESRLNLLEAQLRMSQVRAPFEGLVDKIYLKVGDIAGPMMPVIEFVNLQRLTVRADVSETYLESVHAGEPVELFFSSLPEHKVTSKIERTSKVINPTNRTFQIEVKIHNGKEKIRPNMITAIRINDFTSHNAMVVPSVVIKRDITGDYLYVVKHNEKGRFVAVKKYVERGRSYEGMTMVAEGLVPGDRVITAGYNLVSTGSYVAVNNVNND